MENIQITPSICIGAAFLSESFVRSSGAGGQNVNKVSSAVELRFDLASCPLPDGVKERLAVLAGKRLGKDGQVVLFVQTTRDQGRNRMLARERLADLVRRALVEPKPRVATKPSAGAVARRLRDKAAVAVRKQGRSKALSD